MPLILTEGDRNILKESMISKEEKEIRREAYALLEKMSAEEKLKRKETFILRMTLNNLEIRKILADLELLTFIETKILYENREKYPNLHAKLSGKEN